MARKFNPFHDWLGFDESVTKPSHFELFGVKPHSDDPIGFKKKIHSQAKRLLKRLEIMSSEQIGDRAKLHTKMRRHIVKAHEILLDDKLRAGYKKELRAKIREAKGNALVTPPPKVPSAVGTSAKDTQRETSIRSPRVQQPKKTTPPMPAQIPMAIPVSVDANQNSQHNVNDVSGADEISVKAAVPKPKRSWAIFVVCALMIIFGVAGIAALWMRFGNKFDGHSDFQKPVEQTEQLNK